MRLEALIFDFDGTILDTETPTFHVWSEVYRSHGLDLSMDQWKECIGTSGGFDPWEQLIAHMDQSGLSMVSIEDIQERISRRCLLEHLRPGVKSLLLEAKDLGLRLVIASSSSSTWVKRWLTQHQIQDYFDFTFSKDDVEHVKPAPDLFLLALRTLRLSADRCLVFEDSPHGVHAARLAGIQCVALPNATTRMLVFNEASLVLDTLAGTTLEGISARLRSIADSAPTSSHPYLDANCLNSRFL